MFGIRCISLGMLWVLLVMISLWLSMLMLLGIFVGDCFRCVVVNILGMLLGLLNRLVVVSLLLNSRVSRVREVGVCEVMGME